MTPDERIEKLLNRAGQTISDLPKGDGRHLVYNKELRKSADAAQMKWHGIRTDSLIDVVDGLNMTLDYILHLTDIIDRMETALENVCGERDYLRHAVRVDGCWTCTNSDSGIECHRPEGCVLNDEGRYVGYEYSGIPESWRADDGNDTE